MSIKPRNFQILFLILSLGSVIISSVVFFVFAYQIGSNEDGLDLVESKV